MILDYSNAEDLVYDPFLGGGTTAMAAYRTRRKFVGSEIVETHVRNVEQEIAALERGCDTDESGRLKCDQYLKLSDTGELEDWSDVVTNV